MIFRSDHPPLVGPSLADGPLPPSHSGHESLPSKLSSHGAFLASERAHGFVAPVRFVAFLATTLLLAATGSAQVSTRIASDAPIINFRLPTFTAEGYRDWLVRGSEARMHSAKEIDVRELTLTVFAGDATDKITTMILAPAAKVLPEQRTVTGEQTIRVLNDSLEATGTEWRVHQPGDKAVEISLRKNVRVTFRAELKNLLQ